MVQFTNGSGSVSMTGCIKKTIQDRGFGFIRPNGGGKDLFFHAKGLLNGLGIEDLKEGDHVQFEVEDGEKGPRAIKVERL